MKKSLFMLGVAVAALASCTNEEVTEVAQNRAITFNSFVNNATKATNVTTENIEEKYYVIGFYGDAATSMTTPVFTNEISTSEYFWQASKNYQFSAYSDGLEVLGTAGTVSEETVKFEPSSTAAKMTFTDYTVSDKDLVAAISEVVTTDATPTSKSPVNLTFKHLLSKVQFTISTEIGTTFTLAISDIHFTAAKKGTGVFDGTDVTWTPANNEAYNYSGVENLTTATNKTITPVNLVLPQSGTDKITVEFTATLTGDGITDDGITKKFTADLSVPDENQWKAGYVYNYSTELTLGQFDEDLEKLKITFTPNVTSWNENETVDVPIENPTVSKVTD